MNLEAIKKQVSIESPDYDDDTVECVARGLASAALNKYCVYRHRGDTQSEIYNNTVDDLTGTGFTFEMAKVAVAYAVATRNK